MERNKNVKKVVVIDADSVMYYAGWGVKDSRNEELGISALNNYIYRILKDTEASHYIGFVQTKSHNFRYEIFPDYKIKRPKSEEWYQYWKPIFLKTLYDQWGFMNPTPLNVESDDCMQSAFTILSQLYDPEKEIVLAYVDKDLNNIYSEEAQAHIYFNYSTKNRGWFRVRKERSIFFFWKQMIMGDPGDGLPGIFGKGKAYADKLLLPNQENPRAMFFTVYREYLKHYHTEGRTQYKVMRDCMRLKDEIENFQLPELKEVPNLADKIKADLLNL